MEKAIAKKSTIQITKRQSLYIKDKCFIGYRKAWGALCVFGFTLESHNQELRGILDTGLGNLLSLCVRALHH
jgi:hypothetical protein